jgi:hypothetical protein
MRRSICCAITFFADDDPGPCCMDDYSGIIGWAFNLDAAYRSICQFFA